MTVADLLDATRLPCWHCGDLLARVANTATDEWNWRDAGGSQFATDADLRHLDGGPYGRLKFLAGEIERGHAAPKRAERTWLFWALAREYSMLNVRVSTGTFHEHMPRPSEIPAWQGPPPPEHCGWPMRLRPSGWHCRQNCGATREA